MDAKEQYTEMKDMKTKEPLILASGKMLESWDLSFFKKIHHSLKILRKRQNVRSKWEGMNSDYRKPFFEVMRDMHRLVWRYGCKSKWLINEYFENFAWLKGCDVQQYILRSEWLRVKCWLDSGAMVDVIDSKAQTAQYLSQHGIRVPRELGFLGREAGEDERRACLKKLLVEWGGVFVKPDTGSFGKGCASILVGKDGGYVINGKEQGEEALASFATRRRLRVEELVMNHSRLAAFHPSSTNTLRLVTMKDRGTPRLFASYLRIGTGESIVDNIESGGLAVRIEEDGCLCREGWDGGKGAPCVEHPDTHIIFEGYEIPFFHESVEMVLKAHQAFSSVYGIGWDVAITPQGPLVIEANARFCINMVQYFYGGLRPMLEQEIRPLAELVRREKGY